MNRVLKFRVWDKSTKSWLPEINFKSKKKDYIGFEVFRYPHREMVFQQFTGLLDKNGKGIYEGDIIGSHVSEKPCNYIVKWGETRSDYCGFVLNPVFINPPKFTYIIHNFKMWMAEGFEVFGNIFENPNLLA